MCFGNSNCIPGINLCQHKKISLGREALDQQKGSRNFERVAPKVGELTTGTGLRNPATMSVSSEFGQQIESDLHDIKQEY